MTSPRIWRVAPVVLSLATLWESSRLLPAGDYVYDGETNRTVAVHAAGMTEVLKKVYNAPALLKELGAQNVTPFISRDSMVSHWKVFGRGGAAWKINYEFYRLEGK